MNLIFFFDSMNTLIIIINPPFIKTVEINFGINILLIGAYNVQKNFIGGL